MQTLRAIFVFLGIISSVAFAADTELCEGLVRLGCGPDLPVEAVEQAVWTESQLVIEPKSETQSAAVSADASAVILRYLHSSASNPSLSLQADLERIEHPQVAELIDRALEKAPTSQAPARGIASVTADETRRARRNAKAPSSRPLANDTRVAGQRAQVSGTLRRPAKQKGAITLADLPPHKGAQTKVIATVIYGDLVSNFDVIRSEVRASVEFRNSEGVERAAELKPENFQTVLTEYDKLPTLKKLPEKCERSQIRVTKVDASGQQVTRSGCLAERTPASKAYRRFAKMLVLTI